MTTPKHRSPAKKKAAKQSATKAGGKAGHLVPQKHGGAIHQGAPANPVAGTGRPPDALRAAMRELGATKGLPFLEDVLDGKVSVSLIGKCENCGEVGEPDADWVKELLKGIAASTDQRLKANEQALKYGLGTKDELSVVSPDVVRRLEQQVTVISGRETWTRDDLLAALGPVWS